MGVLHTLLSSPEGFMPHGHCYLWTPELLWTSVISDSLIAIAYFAIPITLIYFIRQRRDIPFNWMFVAFGVFILACGATHIMDVWTTWNPNYWLAAAIKSLTAAASVPTAVLLVQLMPKALVIPSPQQLAKINAQLRNEIAERELVEEQLREEEQHARSSEARLNAFIDNSPSNIAIKDLEGRYVLVNAKFTRSYGLEPQDVLGRTSLEVFPAQQAARYQGGDSRVLQTRTAIEVEETAQYTDGLHTNIVCKFPLFDANMQIIAVGAIATDITERKRAEREVRAHVEQLQALSRQLVEVQESERKRLVRELHDRVGQNLTALGINLDILKTQLSDEQHGGLVSRLDDSILLVESTVDAIENVMSELRPPMLDDHGLLPALQWYTQEFSQRTGIEVEVSGGEFRDRPAQEVEITLFRIAQEALNNVSKHAHATRVDIDFELSGGRCVLSISDDGVGFAAAQSLETTRPGRGLVSMRERAQAVEGQFEVRSVPGGGTQITIRVPY